MNWTTPPAIPGAETRGLGETLERAAAEDWAAVGRLHAVLRRRWGPRYRARLELLVAQHLQTRAGELTPARFDREYRQTPAPIPPEARA